jgi:hypothetical protein
MRLSLSALDMSVDEIGTVRHAAEGAPARGKRTIVTGWRSPRSPVRGDGTAPVLALSASSFVPRIHQDAIAPIIDAATLLKTAMPGWQALLFE